MYSRPPKYVIRAIRGLFGAIVFSALLACGHLTPAQRYGVDLVTCRYARYVALDTDLSAEQRIERLDLVKDLRRALDLGACPPPEEVAP